MERVHIVIYAGKLILENTGYFYWSCNFIVCQSMQPSTLSHSTDLEGQRNDNQMVSVTHTTHLVACRLNCRIPCHSFTCHWIGIASIVLCLVLESFTSHVNEMNQSGRVFCSYSACSAGVLLWRADFIGKRLFIRPAMNKCNFLCFPHVG